jgi:uncharacterized Zn finger protein (UPF0148 family)
MTSLITRSQRSWRRWDKEQYGDEIAAKLNSATPSPAVLRVRAIIQGLQALLEKTANLESVWQKRGAVRGSMGSFLAGDPFADYNLDDPDQSAIATEATKIAEEINALLCRYRWQSAIAVNTDGTVRQTVSWSFLNTETAWENATVHWLLSDLPQSPRGKGACLHFSRCERCGDWFYAGREGARFCKPSCRVMSHVQTEEGRAERALYMRRLRKKKGELKRKRAQSPLETPRTQSATTSKPKGQTSRTERI